MEKDITIVHDAKELRGRISIQPQTKSWVIFAHGSGSSHKSPRNNWVANELNKRGHSTLLFDLLTPQEDEIYRNRFNLLLLAERLMAATKWLLKSSYYHGEPFAYFGASTGAGAALIAAAMQSDNSKLFTVISRGGRPDLAGELALEQTSVPVLLIVGSLDKDVITLNEVAQKYLLEAKLELVAGATHLFEERGKLGEVVELCSMWLDQQLDRWNESKAFSDEPRPYS